VLPPHVWARIQITGRRGAVSTAFAIIGAYEAGRASAAAIADENLRNDRRVIPR
jgi:hypothetical protein